MQINVKNIAKLANLPLLDEEIARFERQLSAILDHIKKLEEVDTKNVEEASNITGLENITKDDIVEQSLSQKDALINTKRQHNGFFEVPAILDE